ncbi:alkaline phosphatase [Actinoplanes sp. URMC 104]|uniref:alkaline phosphatase n=1 Tax=Actinoplanes sp. URMC 104 TaxID=3423409 RepID=UPI003F1A41F4
MSNSRMRAWMTPLGAAALAAAVVAAVNPLQSAVAGGGNGAGDRRVARNVIFMVGDGMAAAHREAARLHLAGLTGKLAMDSLPQTGLMTTSPDDPEATVTDSAAAASAWATGVATYNGAISVDPDGNPLPVLGAQAKAAGKRTGLVTTAQVTDATPAAFYSNSTDRAAQDDIARQFLDVSKPDVILGGGEDWWLPAGTPGAFPDQPPADPTEGSRGTRGNLVERARQLGYTYVTDRQQLLAAPQRDKLLGLFANQEMFQQRPEGQGDVYSPVVDLATMTRTALDHLDDSREGFFLLVEEEGIDEFSHNNNGTRVLQTMAALDRTVALVRSYVARHPDTLLVVVGDHECGGLTIEDVDAEDESGTGTSAEDGPFTVRGSDKRFVMDWTSTSHTGTPLPLTASGPGSDRLAGTFPNTYVHDVLEPALTRR